MQLGNKIINTQTVHPFTSNERRFNMNEKNSTGSCIGCSEGFDGSISLPIERNNAVPNDFTYNSRSDNNNPTYNQWTRSFVQNQ